MTELGGELWSAERKPAWDRLATDRYGRTSSDRELVSVVSPSSDVVEEFLTVGHDTRMWNLDGATIRRRQMQNFALLPWRAFPTVYAAVVLGFSTDAFADQGQYEEREERRT
jgi:hypothetical protein